MEYRANGTYIIEGIKGDNPKLMAQALSDGRDSLYLEFYMGHEMTVSKNGKSYKKVKRVTERLGLYLWQSPRNSAERQLNKEVLDLARRIRFERGQDVLCDNEGYRLKKKVGNFLDWMLGYYNEYTKADKRHIKRACTVFADYLRERAGASGNSVQEQPCIPPAQMNKRLVEGFVDYLLKRFRGDGPHTLYGRFKKIIKAAVEDDVLGKNPCRGISIKIDNGALKKDILSLEEIETLIATHYPGENADIRRAFIFCLYAGLRWCDVKDLTYANIDFANRMLRFEQSKTKGHSSASGVVIPLNDGLLRLIGKGTRNELIFPLPSHTMCLKALRHWVKRAGIDKHITWHCARHSFAVNILNNGANIKTVASLLGHSGLSQTEKYTRAVDSLKEAAINSLPPLML